MLSDQHFMQRCIQLARGGQLNAQPNPMVGAVVVCDGKIIGEGYHVRCGQGHAEVNALASVRPEHLPLLHRATIYVSLEPCSHYGKTPPCADLIIEKGLRRVVVGCVDPFAKVRGRGIQKLRDAGIEVEVGVCEEECKALNKVFFTFHSLQRPFITLKWAQTADGFIGSLSPDGHPQPLSISNAMTRMLSHKQRAEHQAILVGHGTFTSDHPSLTTRHWPGPNPLRLVLSHNSLEGIQTLNSLETAMKELHAQGVQSLLVEGGRNVLQQFLDAGLWDELQVETSPLVIGNGIPAPELRHTHNFLPTETLTINGHTIQRFSHKTVVVH